MTTNLRALAVLASIAFLGGCVTAQLAPTNDDLNAKKFQPPPGQAGLYVFRDEVLESGPFHIMVDGSELGYVGPQMYVYTAVPPGPHTVHRDDSGRETTFTAVAGQTYFVKAPVWGTGLDPVSAADGRTAVAECRLAQSTPLPTAPAQPQPAPAAVTAAPTPTSTPAAIPAPTPTSSSTVVPASATVAAGCAKDTDCKGARICNAGACVDPPVTH